MLPEAGRRVEAGRTVDNVARECGVSQATIYTWKAKYGGLEVEKPGKRCRDVPKFPSVVRHTDKRLSSEACESAGDFFEDVGSFCGPDERFWILVVLVDVVADGHDELFEVFEDAAGSWFSVRSRKKRSTILSLQKTAAIEICSHSRRIVEIYPKASRCHTVYG
jgi:hypothetical protein